MKREFASIIRVALIRNRQLGEAVTLTTYSDVVFEEEAKSSTQGILYEQSLSVAIPYEGANAFLALSPRFHARVELHDGSEFYPWGTVDIPVNVVLIPKAETILFDMSCKSLMPLFHG